MDRPQVHRSTEIIYGGLSPFAQRDPETGYHLLLWLDAICRGSGLAQVFDIVSERDGLPGWGSIMSPDDAPPEGLDWLGQFVGETFTPAMTEEQRREAIKHPINFERGSIDGMRALAGLTLTGTRRVDFFERVEGDAWKLAVRTYDEETPNPNLTEAALIAMKDVSIVLDYKSIPGQTFQQLDEMHEDFTELDEAYETFDELSKDI